MNKAICAFKEHREAEVYAERSTLSRKQKKSFSGIKKYKEPVASGQERRYMVNQITLLEIPRITDPRGNLAVIEKETLPYKVKRVYYLYDVPSDAYRGGHSHKECVEFLVALSGSFDVVLDDGKDKKRVTLNKPNKGLLIPTGMWRELENFSSGAVCLVLASHEYEEADYIRDYDTFIASVNA